MDAGRARELLEEAARRAGVTVGQLANAIVETYDATDNG